MSKTNLFPVDYYNNLRANYLAQATKAVSDADAKVSVANEVYSTYLATLDTSKLLATDPKAVALAKLGGSVLDCKRAYADAVAKLLDAENQWEIYYEKLCTVCYEYVFQHVYYDWNALPQDVQDSIWYLTDQKNIKYLTDAGFSRDHIDSLIAETHSKGLKFVSMVIEEHIKREQANQKAEAEAFEKEVEAAITNIQSGISIADELLKAAGLK